MDDSQQPTAFTFELNRESGALRAQFDPEGMTERPDISSLKLALQKYGYGEFYLDDQAINQLLLNCSTAVNVVEMDIGERRDASFSLEVAEDLMSAWLTLSPAQGGKTVEVEVYDELRDQGICYGILKNELAAALEQGWCERLLIARGEPPQTGTPAWFDVLFRKHEKVTDAISETAKIKYRDLSHLLLVETDDPLMRLHPPVQGRTGMDIKRKVVFPDPLPELTFGQDLQGSKTDQHDPNLLIAAQSGQPVEVDDGVIVNPVISVKNVDLSTGKIVFDGTLHVEGDIKTGMTVKVSGDVIVNGMVESAEIIAGGNVAVKGGIIGRLEKKTGTQNLADGAARIQCGGSAQALFMENVHVEAGNAILITQNARHCELIAKNEIIVSKPGSRAGQIIGGRTQAGMLVQSDILGTNVATKTRIQVGVDPFLDEQIANLQALINRKVAELDQVIKLVVFFERNPHKNVDGIGAKVEAKRQQQLAEINRLNTELKVLEEQQELVDKATVRASTTIHDGVEILIGKQSWKVREDCGGGIYKVLNNTIVLV